MLSPLDNQMILVDASFYLYRSYYAFPSLSNQAGEPTGAIYGVLSVLEKILLKYRPSHIGIVFDSQGKTFRNQIYQYYKAHRLAMPDKLRSQISPLYEIITAMGLPIITMKEVEADDIIGTLAVSAVRAGYSILISTGDKDMAQLVSPKIKLISAISDTLIGPKEVQLKFGLSPELIIDYLALVGDRSDNIPGVPRIGKKTAVLLLKRIGNLKTIYHNLEKIKELGFRNSETVTAMLKQYRKTALISYQLATIKTDVSLKLVHSNLMVKENKAELLADLFRRYEFKRWLNDLMVDKWPRDGRVEPLLPSSCFSYIPSFTK